MPLNSDTICGIAVIGTRRALIQPIMVPSAIAARISPMLPSILPSVAGIAIVATMASSIPAAAIRFPRRAERGCESCLSPMMNATDDRT